MSRSKQPPSPSPGLSASPPGRLWQASPCTLAYTATLPPLDRAQRFHFNSIYYKDDPFKPKKHIDEFLKPQLLVSEFRRNIREAEKAAIRSSSKKQQMGKTVGFRAGGSKDKAEDRRWELRNSREKQVVERLCPCSPRMLKREYDRNGNRSSFYAENNEVARKSPNSGRKSEAAFTDSPRIDMSRPQNFNPGPGTYFNYKTIDSYDRSASHDKLPHKERKSILFNLKKLSAVEDEHVKMPRVSKMSTLEAKQIIGNPSQSRLHNQSKSSLIA